MRLKRLATLLMLPLFFFVLESSSQSTSYPDRECLSCHGKPEISQIMSDGKIRSLFVDPEKWNQDIHQRGNVLCVDCHLEANPYIHFREGSLDVDCARCHPEEAEEYLKNVHLTFSAPSPGKELPLCFHCHTKHNVLPHDDPASSVHEENIGKTCGVCHAEVMVRNISRGASLGKISGHRKGDISERFDMRICISCHYQDSAHGTKRVYKDFCSRCHDVRSMANFITGPTHLSSLRASPLNYLSSALVLTFVVGVCAYLGFRSRENIVHRAKSWLDSMRVEDKTPEKDADVQDKEDTGPPPAQDQSPEAKEEDIKDEKETPEGQKEEVSSEKAPPAEEEVKDTDEVPEEKQEKEPDEGKEENIIPESEPEEEEQTPQTEKEENAQKQKDETGNDTNQGERETE